MRRQVQLHLQEVVPGFVQEGRKVGAFQQGDVERSRVVGAARGLLRLVPHPPRRLIALEVVRLFAAEGQIPVLVLAGVAQLPQRRLKFIKRIPIIRRQVNCAFLEVRPTVDIGMV